MYQFVLKNAFLVSGQEEHKQRIWLPFQTYNLDMQWAYTSRENCEWKFWPSGWSLCFFHYDLFFRKSNVYESLHKGCAPVVKLWNRVWVVIPKKKSKRKTIFKWWVESTYFMVAGVPVSWPGALIKIQIQPLPFVWEDTPSRTCPISNVPRVFSSFSSSRPVTWCRLSELLAARYIRMLSLSAQCWTVWSP
jgi:hypothetical protein